MSSPYDRIGGVYDLLSGPWEGPVRAAALRLLDVCPGERVLEIGAGTGPALPVLARACGPQGRLVGLDLSPGMLRVADRRLRRLGLRGGVGLVRGDARSLPLAAEWCDAALVAFTLELFDDEAIPRVLAGCRRALRPGGRLAIVALSTAGPPSRMQALYLRARRVVPHWLDCRPIDAPAWLEAGGCTVRSCERSSVGGLPVELVLGVTDPSARSTEPSEWSVAM